MSASISLGESAGAADGARGARAVDRRRTPAWIARGSAALCLGLTAVLWLGPALVRDDVFEDDAAHHVFWYYRYADAELFPNDLSIDYFGSPSVAPIGYRALYASLAPVVDVLTAAEWLSVALLAATGLFAYLVGRAAVPERRYTEAAGLAACAITVALLPHVDLLRPMALQRAFAMPLTLMCLWALIARRYEWAGLSWVLAALVYPVIVPVLGLSAGFVFLIDLARNRAMPPQWILNGALGTAAVTIVLLGLGTPQHIGPTVTFEAALRMPEFGPLGRQTLFGQGLNGAWFVHHRTGIGVSAAVLLPAGLAALGAVALGRRRLIPSAAIVMGLTGLALWGVARLTMFDLYLPNRHSRWTVAAAVIVVLTAGVVAVAAKAEEWLERRDTARTERRAASARPKAGAFASALATPRAALVLAVVAPLVVAASLLPAGAAIWRRPVDRDLEAAYAFIASLPKDTLVAAHPNLANYVPLRARRSVLASTETAVSFVTGYYATVVPRIEASLDAAYATDWSALDARLAPYGVDVVLSNRRVFEHTDYHPPFDARVTALTRTGGPYVLLDPPPDRVLFRSGETVVVEVRDPRGAASREVHSR